MVKRRFVLRIEDVTLSFPASDASRYHRINDRSPPRAYPTEIAPQSRPRDGRYIFALKTSLVGAGFRALSILTYLPFRCDPSGFTILQYYQLPPVWAPSHSHHPIQTSHSGNNFRETQTSGCRKPIRYSCTISTTPLVNLASLSLRVVRVIRAILISLICLGLGLGSARP